MRFRGKLVDIGCIQHFSKVVNTISKLAKTCVFRVTGEKVYFILAERVANGGTSIWCELAQDHFFAEYCMDGLSEENNEIFLELAPDAMVRALKSATAAKSVKIKLTKKHVPCLTVEIELPSLTAQSRTVVHDIPVDVLPRRLWDDYDEPDMPEFDVSVYMPNLKLVKNVVERMKTLANFVTLSANHAGEMRLKAETDMATITTHFKDLTYPTWNKQGPASQQRPHHNEDPNDFWEARIDVRKLSQFLVGQQVNPSKVICNIVDHRTVHFFLIHDDVTIQYFIPVTTY